MTFIHRPSSGVSVVVFALAVSLVGCAAPPPRREHREVVADYVPPPSTQIVFYPAAGQSPEQQDRDRYECYEWSVKQTGFDPSRAPAVERQRVEVVPGQAPGHDTAVGAVTGAALGAAVSRPREALGGALVGAVAGAIIGGASDAARQQQADREAQRYNDRTDRRVAQQDEQVENYRRAMTACLQGRNYTVN